MTGFLVGLIVFAGPCQAQADAVGEWHKRLLIQLTSNKRFPPTALNERGKVIVEFVVDRNGGLVSSRLAESSGVAAFDQEALALVARAAISSPAERGGR